MRPAAMMLLELHPQLLKLTSDDGSFTTEARSLDEADGILFVCPKCYAEKGNTTIGAHSVMLAVPASM